MRFISPSFLVFTLLMSLLPWVEVRCEQLNSPPPFNEYPVLQQNAWQATWGGSSGNLPDERQLRGRPFNPNDPGGFNQLRPVWTKPDLAAAPLVGVFLVCVFAGVILGYALPSSNVRKLVMAALCVTALAVLITQIAIGFPLKRLTRPDVVKFLEVAMPNNAQWRGPQFIYTPAYTIWLYLALASTLGAGVGVLVEVLTPPRKRRPWEEEDDEDDYRRRKRRRRRDYDEDEDEDEFYDPGPRRRFRRREDD
jgi:hypothetical protein